MGQVAEQPFFLNFDRGMRFPAGQQQGKIGHQG